MYAADIEGDRSYCGLALRAFIFQGINVCIFLSSHVTQDAVDRYVVLMAAVRYLQAPIKIMGYAYS